MRQALLDDAQPRLETSERALRGAAFACCATLRRRSARTRHAAAGSRPVHVFSDPSSKNKDGNVVGRIMSADRGLPGFEAA